MQASSYPLPIPSLIAAKLLFCYGFLCVCRLISVLFSSFQLQSLFILTQRSSPCVLLPAVIFHVSIYVSIYQFVNVSLYRAARLILLPFSGFWSINLALCPLFPLFQFAVSEKTHTKACIARKFKQLGLFVSWCLCWVWCRLSGKCVDILMCSFWLLELVTHQKLLPAAAADTLLT